MERPGRLERTLEERGCEMLSQAGAYVLKMGQDGAPDRIVLWGGRLHFWIEFKKDKKAKLQPGQPVWRKMLLAARDDYYLVDNIEQVVQIIAFWEMLHGSATARQLLRLGSLVRLPDSGGPAILSATVHRLHRP